MRLGLTLLHLIREWWPATSEKCARAGWAIRWAAAAGMKAAGVRKRYANCWAGTRTASRSWRQVWRITCSVRRYQLSAAGERAQPTPATARLHLPLEKKRSMESVCSMTTPSEASRHGRHQLTCSGSCWSAAKTDRFRALDWDAKGSLTSSFQACTDSPRRMEQQLRLRTNRCCLCRFVRRCSLGSQSLRVQAPKSSPNFMAARLRLSRSLRRHCRRHCRIAPARLLSLIYAANLRLQELWISSLTAVMISNRRNLTFKRSATGDSRASH